MPVRNHDITPLPFPVAQYPPAPALLPDGFQGECQAEQVSLYRHITRAGLPQILQPAADIFRPAFTLQGSDMCGENGAVSVLCSASGLETGFPGFLTQSGHPGGPDAGLPARTRPDVRLSLIPAARWRYCHSWRLLAADIKNRCFSGDDRAGEQGYLLDTVRVRHNHRCQRGLCFLLK